MGFNGNKHEQGGLYEAVTPERFRQYC